MTLLRLNNVLFFKEAVFSSYLYHFIIDINECTTNTDNCHKDANINECTTNTDNCHQDAECTNIIGSFNCTCKAGYSGDGVNCTDNNECTTNTHNCHQDADCTNILGSFNCTCKNGYSGDGGNCTGILNFKMN
ncbi:hypothetical protein KUTeg_015640 [Tegillarca granosa]|uniref:EGF-like domain-containing protein n=1 Tax=Tegillarca granosa TaxID=220873 RepID=A0ABQ9EUC6_TEGGR|nr:hypothetical protein KUTeg_015640 [Tegillarca granosa]